MNELALFAGAGGGILGGKLLGWTTVCAVEIDDYARRVLMSRQDDGSLPPFPIWDDVRTFDGRPWRGVVDIVTGGFPCQDISSAGKGAGIDGSRSGLWGEMARIICEVGPRYVLVENSPMLTSRGLGRVVGDLAAMGYDAQWGVLGAIDAGAPHKRERIWIVAYAPRSGSRGAGGWLAAGQPRLRCSGSVAISMADATDDRLGWRQQQPQGCKSAGDVADADRLHEQGQQSCRAYQEGRQEQGGRPAGPRNDVGTSWSTEPDVGRVAHGVAARVDRLRCLGNGQVPAVVRLAWNILTQTT